MIGTSEKRSQDAEEFDQKIKILIVDIEGTTTSISFVKDTLFPYIRENLQVYLKNNWKEPDFVEDLSLLRKQAESDKENGVEGVVPIPAGNDDEVCQAVLKNILWQMDLDRKTTALKQVQGHVMREGYLNGKLKGHVYDDVQPALKSWKHSGRQVYVYSSGSVAAQKLLFEFSEKGDLLELFSGHFDTEMGSKIDSSSYSNIAKKINCKCEEIMFLTDIPKEAVAAREAGLHAVLVARPGNAPLTDDDCHKFRVVKSFDDIVFEASAKRTKLSVEDHTTDNTASIEQSNTNSDMQMDVDVEDSCPKVSEGATLASESQEKSQNKTEEGSLLQNGSTQKEDGAQKVETSNEEEKVKKTEVEKDNEELKSKKSMSKPKTDSSGSDSSSKIATVDEAGSKGTKDESLEKTESIKKDAHIEEMDVQKSACSEESKNVLETPADKTAGVVERKEAESEKEKTETDKCTVEKTDNKEETETAKKIEEVQSDRPASDKVTKELAGDAKTVESELKTADSCNETKTADSSKEAKTADSSKEAKTADSSKEAKTADSSKEAKTTDSSGETKTVRTTDEEKLADSVGEAKTVDSSSKNKKVGVETTSIDKELKACDEKITTETENQEAKVHERIVSNTPEDVEEVKVSKVVEEVKTPETTEVKAPEIAEAANVPELKQNIPEVAEEVKDSEEVVTTEIAEEVKASEDAEKTQNSEVTGDKSIEIAEEVKVPEVPEKAKTPELAEEVKAPGDAENVKEPKNTKEEEPEIVKKVSSLDSANEVVTSKTIEELQTSKTADEKMECEEESKTDKLNEQLEASKTAENDSASQSAGDTKMQETRVEGTASKNKKNDVPESPKKDAAEIKEEGKLKSLEKTEEKVVTESCHEKLAEKDLKGPVNEKIVETACSENGETGMEIEAAAPDSLDNGQNVENKVTDKEVPMKVENENKTRDNDQPSKTDEAMETDGQDAEPIDKDTPMDVEGSETSTGNGENTEIKNDEGKENVTEVESKTNGINNSHTASPAKNDTKMKILDKETIKPKKMSEESETAKLITPPSAQS